MTNALGDQQAQPPNNPPIPNLFSASRGPTKPRHATKPSKIRDAGSAKVDRLARRPTPDAIDLAQLVRRRLDDVEYLLAESAHELLRISRPHAPDHAGREVLLDPVGRGRGRCAQEPGLELLAVCPIADPFEAAAQPSVFFRALSGPTCSTLLYARHCSPVHSSRGAFLRGKSGWCCNAGGSRRHEGATIRRCHTPEFKQDRFRTVLSRFQSALCSSNPPV